MEKQTLTFTALPNGFGAGGAAAPVGLHLAAAVVGCDGWGPN